MAHVTTCSLPIKTTFSCEVIHAFMPWEKWLAIGRVVVYYAWANHAFSAGITRPHCNTVTDTFPKCIEPDSILRP